MRVGSRMGIFFLLILLRQRMKLIENCVNFPERNEQKMVDLRMSTASKIIMKWREGKKRQKNEIKRRMSQPNSNFHNLILQVLHF